MVSRILSCTSDFFYKKLISGPLALVEGIHSQRESEISRLRKELENAPNYEIWSQSAHKLDELEGNEEWKSTLECDIYDYKLIAERITQLKEAKKLVDQGENSRTLVNLLRTGLNRNLGGLGDPRLHEKCHIGTKHQIEEFVNLVVELLHFICDTELPDFPVEKKFDFFWETRQAFGRTALCLSGGATLGMYHFGVLKALFEHRLLPRVISGSSVGSIVAALIATRTDEELPDLFSLRNVNFNAFEPSGSIQRKLHRLVAKGVLMDINKLQDCLRVNIGDITFKEAYEKTKRILNITVSPVDSFGIPQLLNYLTAPNVLIWSAASASCALSFLYEPVELMAKDEFGNISPYHTTGLLWSDGSLENDLPMTRLSELFNVNHFVVSQVNPHVLPFMSRSDTTQNEGLVNKLKSCILSEVQHRILQLGTLGLIPKRLSVLPIVLSQKYRGDITIIPDFTINDYLRLLSNPTPEWVKEASLKAERKTWSKLSLIQHHCAIEFALDECLQKLRKTLNKRHKENAFLVYKNKIK